MNAKTAFLTADENRNDDFVLFWLKKVSHDNQTHSIICVVARKSSEAEHVLSLPRSK